jgi:hypothetical protein
MPTTTKMGIVYPASTDLVKDGATAMGTISTTVDNKTGLILLKTYSPSAVSSLSIDTNSFSSTYRNYLIKFNTAGSASTSLRLRLRASGVDTSASSYVWSVTRSTYAGGSFGGYSGNGLNYFEIMDLNNSSTDVFDGEINIYRPKESVYTNIGAMSRGAAHGAVYVSGSYNTTDSYDAVTLFPASGNFTGFVQVYGYNQ